ncbi:TetR/AcrR family transcriptional regulator [Actinoplanes sp. NPDC051851]|uniref:TetR/AcrR family transcriptional regulator n=1 Tax=Actinoplanes sp. NPDC051851 TaxID=3154753 RepID=UPI00341E46BA
MTLKSRRRGPELEDAILDAAWDVLRENGYHGFTFEAIAARAGTSRPVLYRRWPQREDLMLATLQKFWWARVIEVPDTGNLRDDVIGFMRNANEGRAALLSMISAQLMEYFNSTGSSFRDLRDRLRPPGRPNTLEVLLRRAVERGELPGMPRSPRVVTLPFDLFRHELFMTMQGVPDETIIEIVDEVWLPVLGLSAPRVD